ncbi:hypothetical protein GGI15_002527 [Coemansia interrupta]|uniref:Uncharacterized protein n=1 Tax=Coemansia interrupta TaxID=1126814 RepID=A0A9W8HGN6_9FUNG|nr:hypothetical protein GGI15_002527 [Coemansia interrupta]
MAAESRATLEAEPAVPEGKLPVGGRYVALLRRTATGVLFSDPIFVAQGHNLPDLPDGLQYIVIHPSPVHTASTNATGAKADDAARTYTMEAYLPKSNSSGSGGSSRQQGPGKESVVLPVFEDFGLYSSFLPMRDSLHSTLSSADRRMLGNAMSHSKAGTVSPQDLDYAVELAEKVLGDLSTTNTTELSTELLRDLGLTAADLEIESQEQAGGQPAGEPETAESILNANDMLLARLLEMQDARAAGARFEVIGEEEKKVAERLQINLARVAAAQTPAALRPSTDAIQSAAALLLAKDQGSYSGTLQPNQRFAFISNAASGAGFPQNATMAPMQPTQATKYK